MNCLPFQEGYKENLKIGPFFFPLTPKITLLYQGNILSVLYTYKENCCSNCRLQAEDEREKNGSEEDDDEKPGKRVVGPRKKFHWDDTVR